MLLRRRHSPAEEDKDAGSRPDEGRTEDPVDAELDAEASPLSFKAVFGADARDVSSWRRFVALLFRPSDPASLGVIRALFGLLMLVDILEERGLGEADVRWASPLHCHFPLFDFLRPPSLPWMCMVYLVMWMGALGMMLGYRFRLSCLLFAAPYWFVLLLDKSRWNNHSYLFGIVAILLSRSSAHHYLSLDAWRASWRERPVPLWNYAALRLQFFLLYFLAGVKKLDAEWLGGYSMTHLNDHWVFEPFKLLLTPEQVDYWIVHVTGFSLDLTIGFWMFLDATRPVAFVFCAMFHLMNSRLFMIGMFPYVCLATMPLFCHNDWPRRLKLAACRARAAILRGVKQAPQDDPIQDPTPDPKEGAEPQSWAWQHPLQHRELVLDAGCLLPFEEEEPVSPSRQQEGSKRPTRRGARLRWHHHLTAALLLSHTGMQLFLPYSHFITKGYNTWTNGLYGYSWDMMIHSWDTVLVVVKVVERDSGREHFLDPDAWVGSTRWTRHADMAKQYAGCVDRNLRLLRPQLGAQGLAVHVDAWCSLNGRFQQRVFDPRVDLLTAPWSPFQPVSWVMPLLNQLAPMRQRIRELEAQVEARSNASGALFVADFPGLHLENYISELQQDVTLTVLSGRVVLELNPELAEAATASSNVTLAEGESAPVPSRAFHRVHTVSDTPACYMYAFTDKRLDAGSAGTEDRVDHRTFLGAARHRVRRVQRAAALIGSALLNIISSVPMEPMVQNMRVG